MYNVRMYRVKLTATCFRILLSSEDSEEEGTGTRRSADVDNM